MLLQQQVSTPGNTLPKIDTVTRDSSEKRPGERTTIAERDDMYIRSTIQSSRVKRRYRSNVSTHPKDEMNGNKQII